MIDILRAIAWIVVVSVMLPFIAAAELVWNGWKGWRK